VKNLFIGIFNLDSEDKKVGYIELSLEELMVREENIGNQA